MSLILMNQRSSAPSNPASGKQFIYPKTDGFWYSKTPNGIETKITGATSFSDLLDVDISTPEDGDIMIYNAANSQWENGKNTAYVFGCGAEEASSNVAASNSTNTYQTYLELTTTPCAVDKKHRVGAFIIWAMSATNKNFDAIFTAQQGSGPEVTVGEMLVRSSVSGSQYRTPSSGFFYYTPTTGDPVVLRLKYRVNGATAYLYYAGLEWWRTSL
jgi:hypothetical protein